MRDITLTSCYLVFPLVQPLLRALPRISELVVLRDRLLSTTSDRVTEDDRAGDVLHGQTQLLTLALQHEICLLLGDIQLLLKNAPFRAREVMGTSPWAVMKIIGMNTPAFSSASWNSRPLTPGSRTSSTRQLGTSGREAFQNSSV